MNESSWEEDASSNWAIPNWIASASNIPILAIMPARSSPNIGNWSIQSVVLSLLKHVDLEWLTRMQLSNVRIKMTAIDKNDFVPIGILSHTCLLGVQTVEEQKRNTKTTVHSNLHHAIYTLIVEDVRWYTECNMIWTNGRLISTVRAFLLSIAKPTTANVYKA